LTPRWLSSILVSLLLLGVCGAQALPLGPDGKPLGRLGQHVEARFLYPVGKFFEYDTLFPVVLEYQNLTSVPQYFTLDWNLETPVPEGYRTLRLEAGAKKRIPFLLPAGEAGQLHNVQVNKQSLAGGLQSNSQTRSTGLLSAESESLDYLRSLQLEKNPYYNPTNQPDGEEYTTLSALSQMNHEVFPDHWGALGSLDFIVCYDLNALAFGARQYEALERWLQMGGQLVVITNGLPNEYKGTRLEKLLPLDPKTAITSEDRITVTGPLKEGSRVSVGTKDKPLLLTRDILRGRVHFVATPLLDTNLLGKEQTQSLWRVVFDAVDPTQNQANQVITYSILDSIPELPRTQAGWVALFVILYGIVVGPINLSVLRKRDKMLYAFVSVPLVAFFFAGSAYVVNRVLRPSTPVIRELGWFRGTSGQMEGPAEAEQVLFSPNATTFTMTSGESTVFELSRHTYRSQPHNFTLFNITPEGGLKSTIGLGTWDIQRFNSRSVLSLKSAILVEFDSENTVTITSPLASDGESAVIALPDGTVSDAFVVNSGTHTYQLKMNSNSSPSSILTFDGKLYPGRDILLQQVWSQMQVKTTKGYLFFWSDGLKTPLEVDQGALHRHDYLVSVEFDQ
jgi:hypothetical protein